MRKLILLPILALAMACTDSALLEPPVEREIDLAVAAKKTAPTLQNTIDFDLAVIHGIPDDAEGRVLVWLADISGDINGKVAWWFVPPWGPPSPSANVSFYEARWEIWETCTPIKGTELDCSNLLLAGNSSGTTAQARRQEKDGIWRGNGVVTEAYGDFAGWNGRRIFEGGNVDWAFPYSGEGKFRIN